MAGLLHAINWVITRRVYHRRPTVLSMSLGSRSNGYYAGERVLQKAWRAGVIMVVAAGNARTDGCTYWPGRSRFVINVGSTDWNDRLSSFSNYGACVDLYAPGTRITSTVPGRRLAVRSGTSMACPIVSGAVAMYLEGRPHAKLREVRAALIRNAVGRKEVVPARRILLVHVHDRVAAVSQNATAVAQNATAVSRNATAVSRNATAVSRNATAVSRNATAVEQNATAVDQNATAVAPDATPAAEHATPSAPAAPPAAKRRREMGLQSVHAAGRAASGNRPVRTWALTFVASTVILAVLAVVFAGHALVPATPRPHIGVDFGDGF